MYSIYSVNAIEPGTLLLILYKILLDSHSNKETYFLQFGASRTGFLVRSPNTLIKFDRNRTVKSFITVTPGHIEEEIFSSATFKLPSADANKAYVIERYEDILDILPVWIVLSCDETMKNIFRIYGLTG